jgi:Protein of unknown function (DUF3999)
MIRFPLALAVLLLPVLAAAEAPSDFQATAPIMLQGDGPYYRLTLPIQANFAAHSPDLRDLRVFNSQGDAVRFSLIRDQARTEQTEQQVPLKWFPLYAADATSDTLRQVKIDRRSDGTIVSVLDGDPAAGGAPKLRGYLLDTSQAKGADLKLTLDWDPAITGFQQLAVEASDDLQSWQRWEGAAQLARLEFNGEHVERKQIDLPGGHAAYLRLTWHVPAEAPALTAAVLTIGNATDRPAGLTWSDPTAPSRSGQDGYEWDYQRPIAIERLKLALPQVNVLSPVDIATRDETVPHAEWRVLARSVLYRLLIDGKEWQQQDISLYPTPIRTLRIAPDARGGGLGGAPTLAVGVTAQQLVFLASGSGPFRLAIGKDDAKAADLPPATLMPGYGSTNAPPISVAQLGSLTGSTGQSAAGGALSELPTGGWQSLVLWGVLLIGIGAIGFMAVRLLRQTKA